MGGLTTKLSLRRSRFLSRGVLDMEVEPELRCLRTGADFSSLEREARSFVAGFFGERGSNSNSSDVCFLSLRRGVKVSGGDDASLRRECSLGSGGTRGEGGSSGEGDDVLTASEGCKKPDACGFRG